MSRRILILQGHPDPRANRYGHALSAAYESGARDAGHAVRRIDVAQLEFPLLRTKEDWEDGRPPETLLDAQAAIAWCEHVVILYPLWLGAMPALLKGFLEQVMRPGFAIGDLDSRVGWTKHLKGRSARIVVTMGMPALVYKWFFRAHSLKSLERNILKFAGIGPIRESVIGLVDSGLGKRERWLSRMRELGARGA